eukprot:jgi/Galph1/6004/GphlegSOOS_G4655.1
MRENRHAFDKGLQQSFDNSKLFQNIQHCKILLVGVGGVGSEILKNLVLSGFVNIHIVDLDTISLSNLNRQFLFRPENVGQAKAQVAAKRIKELCPSAEVISYVEDIRSEKFSIKFFKQFQCVICALDNHKARSYVNEICAFAQTPLFDTGSTGYQGQVIPMLAGTTECYNCEPKVVQKEQIPVCTIRHHPENMNHCIVWALHLYNLLFGDLEQGNALSDEKDYSLRRLFFSASEQKIEWKSEIKEFSDNYRDYICRRILNRFFVEDIEYVRTLRESSVLQSSITALNLNDIKQSFESAKKNYSINVLEKEAEPGRASWDISKACEVFIFCTEQLLDKWIESKSVFNFDESETVSMAFITATATLRAKCFGIEAKNCFEVKGIAARIVPALATTNAVIGGIVVFQLLRYMSGVEMNHLNNVRLSQVTRPRPRHQDEVLITSEVIREPSPSCMICHHLIIVTANAHKVTLKELIRIGLNEQLGIVPFSVATDDGYILFEAEQDGDTESIQSCDSIMASLGLKHKLLSILDDQGKHFRLLIQHEDVLDGDKTLSAQFVFQEQQIHQTPPSYFFNYLRDSVQKVRQQELDRKQFELLKIQCRYILNDPPLNPNIYLDLLKEARDLLKFKGFRERFDVVKQDPFYKEIAQDEKIISAMTPEERLDLFRLQRLQIRRIAEAAKISDEVVEAFKERMIGLQKLQRRLRRRRMRGLPCPATPEELFRAVQDGDTELLGERIGQRAPPRQYYREVGRSKVE